MQLDLTGDSGYVVVGFTSVNQSFLDENVFLLRLDQNGDTIWTRHYGTSGGHHIDRGYDVKLLNDGGFIVVGTAATDTSDMDVLMIRTDEYGDTLWVRAFGGDNGDFGYSVLPTNDEGFLVAGLTGSYGEGKADIYLLKTDSTGNLLWAKTYGDSSNNEAVKIIDALDGGFLLLCSMEMSISLQPYILMVKIDSIGNVEWSKSYVGLLGDDPKDIVVSNDSNYVVTGYAGTPLGAYDVLLLKVNLNGDTLLTKAFGSNDVDKGIAIQNTFDAKYMITGMENSYNGPTIQNIYLIKTDSLGNTGCFQNPTEFQVATPTLIEGSGGTSKPILLNVYNTHTLVRNISMTDSLLCSSWDAIEENNRTTGMNISLFPNPALSTVNISFNGIATENTDCYVSIIDLNGSKIGEWMVRDQTSVQISIEGIISGIYTLTVRNNGELFERERLIILNK